MIKLNKEISLTCSVCSCPMDPFNVKYHNTEKTHAFCGAECSLKWYHENDDYYKNMKRKKND